MPEIRGGGAEGVGGQRDGQTLIMLQCIVGRRGRAADGGADITSTSCLDRKSMTPVFHPSSVEGP